MILSFKCHETEVIWKGNYSLKFPREIQKRALRKLRLLNISTTLNDFRIPPSNHFKMLEDDRLGQYSIRINLKWRICFKWDGMHTFDIEIVDYH
jgi:proteic killer suppression protein